MSVDSHTLLAHNAGASEGQELAAVLATVVAYLRAAEAAGIAPAQALPKIAVTLAVGILTTLFTAFTMTKFFVAMWVKRNRPKEINL